MKKQTNIMLMNILLFMLMYSVPQAHCELMDDLSEYLLDIPFAMGNISVPVFPDNDINIIHYNAVGDGRTLNTNAINQAIQKCAEKGGGRVIIPAGIWLTGPFQLQSNINLHLERNALLLFSGNFDDYKVMHTNWEGIDRVRCESPISGINLENVAITGNGIIDGSGDAWRPMKKEKLTERQWKNLVASGGALNEGKDTWWPSEGALNGGETVATLMKENAALEEFRAAREFLRPVLISLVGCKNVLLDGPTFQNSPSWNIHPLLCENLVVRNITVRNPWYSQNGDGIDIDACRDVVLYNSSFDVGDDAICMKSGRDEAGRKRGRASKNIIIANCTVYHGHGGFTIGSEMSGGVNNILIRDCNFIGTDVGLRFKSTRGRGGVVENIYIQRIRMTDIPTDAIRFNMYYQNAEPLLSDAKVYPITEETPSFRRIYISDVICRGAGRAIFLQGLPEIAINQIEFTNVDITSDQGMIGIDAERIKLNNVSIQPKQGPAFHLFNSKDVSIENLKDLSEVGTMIKIDGKKASGIKIKSPDAALLKSKIELSKDVEKNAVIWE